MKNSSFPKDAVRHDAPGCCRHGYQPVYRLVRAHPFQSLFDIHGQCLQVFALGSSLRISLWLQNITNTTLVNPQNTLGNTILWGLRFGVLDEQIRFSHHAFREKSRSPLASSVKSGYLETKLRLTWRTLHSIRREQQQTNLNS
jgi:hypothetical protein